MQGVSVYYYLVLISLWLLGCSCLPLQMRKYCQLGCNNPAGSILSSAREASCAGHAELSVSYKIEVARNMHKCFTVSNLGNSQAS